MPTTGRWWDGRLVVEVILGIGVSAAVCWLAATLGGSHG